MPYFKFDGIERLLQRAHAAGKFDRLIVERDRLADELGVQLTDEERSMIRAVSESSLRSMLQAMGGADGPLARPRPFAPMPRDHVTRGIRSRD